MQVHTARSTSANLFSPFNLNLNSFNYFNFNSHSRQRPEAYLQSLPPIVAIDNAILRKHIVHSRTPRSTMLAPNNTKSNTTIAVHPKPRPLVEQDFEVIGLSDDSDLGTPAIGVRLPPGAARRSSNANLTPISTHLRSTPNGSATVPAPVGGRDLVSAKTRPSLAITQSSPAVVDNHLAPPARSSRRKKSPTTVRGPTSRHSSPGPPSPRAISLNISGSGTNLNAKGLPTLPYNHGSAVRRSSWQPGRKTKTVEEIEKECDDDDDDEIPEDIMFWNIPLSPRAGKSLPSAGSKSPSPDRLSDSTDSRRNSEIDGAPKEETVDTPTASQSSVSLPSLSRSESGESESRGRMKSRGKSWGDVMHELGHDAKELTEALERYADESIEAKERELQKQVKASRNVSTTPPRRESRIALPPKQVSEGIMGALPISKEKEAALSRTRPGWLPPKNKIEEEKHLKEYQEMMRLSLESDRKRAEKEKLEAATREKQRETVHKNWDDKIVPNWNKAILEPTTREMWWSGVSPKSRGVVWQRAIGNPLSVSDETYKIALDRAKKLDAELNAIEDRHPQKDQFADIRKDAENTFPELKLFQVGGPMHQSLADVLMAYSVYRKDIGYSFGLHLLAGHLLLNLSAPDAFQTLANLLNRQLPLSFYTQDEPQITNIYNAFLRAFQYKLPSLYQHIHVKLQLPPPLYLEAMFTTLFTLHVPIDIVSRLWDVYAFEGDAFLVRTAVAVLTILEGRLYGTKEEVMALLGWEGRGCMDKGEWRLGKEDEFMGKVRSAGKVEADES
ncbi:hypothetical protein TWF694_011005 [Orbilia ellipsospora]|uniref:Rab-GAP TBC domain-containing protein n=1 Tax=Orbilia ellipsospora TaxID=2528407 RepID=A0AAV9X850_9PEZI